MLRPHPFVLVLSFILLIASTANATHNRAGEIIYEQIGDLTIKATIITYTKTSSQSADRDSLELFWGDGSSEFVIRKNGEGLPLQNDVKLNFYEAIHTYPGRASYTLSMTDPNRVANIVNVNAPYSEDVPFYLETSFTFLNAQFEGYNNSVVLLQAPVDFACIGKKFIHNPNAYDVDGDSLVFELIVPYQATDSLVPDYKYPNEILPGTNNIVSFNTTNGNFIWNTPQMMGEYNIAIRVHEYRNGTLISSMIRDMQIFVENCSNNPPEIEIIDEICVVAGELLELDIQVTDQDIDQLVSLTASGGPFELGDESAVLEVVQGFQSPPFSAKLKWQTTCNHIAKQSYQVVFRAVDNFFQDTTGLADLKSVKIKVVGPPPENLEANTSTGEVDLFWDSPYDCEITNDNYFQGFSVWRKIGSNPFEIDTCSPGLDGKGYDKIKYITTDQADNHYVFKDTNVERGKTYCYRVLAEFAKTSAAGFPFNRVESLASNEVCVQISRDLPLFTKVSILATSESEGIIDIKWTKPLVEDLDTLKNPGPYIYQLQRGVGFNPVQFMDVPGANFVSQNFADPIDTTFIDSNLNTKDQAYTYQLEFYVNGGTAPYGISSTASSIFTNITSTDKKNILTWEFFSPWENFKHTIFRYNDGLNAFDSIAQTFDNQFTDFGLTNGKEYCYYVKSYGTYGIQGIESPLINLSQEICGTPLDTIAPCPPSLTVSNICEQVNPDITLEDFINILNWTNPNLTCEETQDVVEYNIYYTPIAGQELELIYTQSVEEINHYEHAPELGLAGCYAVSAVDSVGNVSDLSNLVCVDNCPVYELPNVFTPNEDGANDVFIPLEHRFIDHIEMSIYNRWGELVFETEDKLINWDGKNLRSKDVSEGVYFYKCTIFELRVDGIIKRNDELSGFIHLIRGK